MSLTLRHLRQILLTIETCSGHVQIFTIANVSLFWTLHAEGMNDPSRAIKFLKGIRKINLEGRVSHFPYNHIIPILLKMRKKYCFSISRLHNCGAKSKYFPW